MSVTTAVTIAWSMETFFQSAIHVSLFLCAIMFSAWFGGMKPALLAILLSTLTFDYYFLTRTYSFTLEIKESPRLLIFVLSARLVGALSVAQRSAAELLLRARDAHIARVMTWENWPLPSLAKVNQPLAASVARDRASLTVGSV